MREYEVTFKVKLEAENADDAATTALALLDGGGTAEVEVRRSMGGGSKRVVAYVNIRGAWAWTHRTSNP